MKHVLLIGVLLAAAWNGSAQQAERTANGLGIFDKTADWGLEPEFPPRVGEHKVPGRVEVTGSGDALIYDVYGNGDNFWDNRNDEGFYVYTERSGSWTLTARTQWIDKGGTVRWAKIGPMIREKGAASDALKYILNFNSDNRKDLGTDLRTLWRRRGMEYGYIELPGLQSIIPVPNPGRGVYLRLSRYASKDLLVAEWSRGGVEWGFVHGMHMPMAEEVAYGLAVSNMLDNEQLAHVRFTEVSLEKSPLRAIRLFDKDYFSNFENIRVTLEVLNPKETAEQVVVREILPEGWLASHIDRGGHIENGIIRWSLSVDPGSTMLSYIGYCTAAAGRDATFSGTTGSLSTVGEADLHRLGSGPAAARSHTFYTTLFVSVPLVMLFAHLSLFIFYPGLRENLYYSFLLCGIAVKSYLHGQLFTVYGIGGYVEAWRLLFMVDLATVLFSLLLFYQIAYSRVLKRFWIFAVGAACMAPMPWFWFMSSLIPLGIFSLIALLEVLRAIARAIHMGRAGIKIISVGAGFMVLVSLWQSTAGYLGIVPLIPSPYTNQWAQLVFLLSMSLSLSYRFARNSKELSALTVELEARVQSRTARLAEANDELQAANESLLELDKMKSSFVSQASHDLRTPLTAIKGSLDNLMRGVGGGLNERQERIMDRAVRSVNRLGVLINDVLDINRIESGRAMLEKTTVQFEALVQNIVHENLPAADGKRIVLLAEGLADPYPLELDAGKMERVVGELIGNAIKYTPEGKQVFVSLSRKAGKALLSVRDTGIGMTPEECEKIFERFYRTAASQKMAKGTGLGLSIAKELVELHEGTLTVESREGEGSTFTMTLPDPPAEKSA